MKISINKYLVDLTSFVDLLLLHIGNVDIVVDGVPKSTRGEIEFLNGFRFYVSKTRFEKN